MPVSSARLLRCRVPSDDRKPLSSSLTCPIILGVVPAFIPELFTGAVITIDGPAGSGKSTTARLLAEKIGFDYLDTGAMYRTITLLVEQRGGDLNDERELLDLLTEFDAVFTIAQDRERGTRVHLGHEDVTDLIRSSAIDRRVSAVSALPQVRKCLVRWQRRRAARGNVVLEGRDTGTVVCPDADVKIYLEASLAERAARRAREQGRPAADDELQRDLANRDQADSERAHGPLRKPDDAIVVDTSSLSISQQVEMVYQICRERLRERRGK